TLAVDLLGRELGWRVEADHATVVHASAAVVNDEPVALVQETGDADWWARHSGGREGPLPPNLARFDRLEQVPIADFAAVLWISRRPLPDALAAALAGKCVIYRPSVGEHTPTPRFALGLGCDRDTPVVTLERAITEALARAGATLADVAAVASIDIKASEPAFAQVAGTHRWHIRFHSAEELAAVPVPNPSATVLRHTGTPSVSAAAALLAAGSGELVVEKHVRRGSDGRSATVSVVRIGDE
ncbi:MAG: cobalamin biosynthesis protein, partial [Rhodocyclaceae bacterium]